MRAGNPAVAGFHGRLRRVGKAAELALTACVREPVGILDAMLRTGTARKQARRPTRSLTANVPRRRHGSLVLPALGGSVPLLVGSRARDPSPAARGPGLAGSRPWATSTGSSPASPSG